MFGLIKGAYNTYVSPYVSGAQAQLGELMEPLMTELAYRGTTPGISLLGGVQRTTGTAGEVVGRSSPGLVRPVQPKLYGGKVLPDPPTGTPGPLAMPTN